MARAMKAVITISQLDVIFYERHCPNRMSFLFDFLFLQTFTSSLCHFLSRQSSMDFINKEGKLRAVIVNLVHVNNK